MKLVLFFLSCIFFIVSGAQANQAKLYSVLFEEDGNSIFFISDHEDGTTSGAIIQKGGYKWFNLTFNTEVQPNVYLTPTEHTQDGNMSSYLQERYQIANFRYDFVENQNGDQVLYFLSKEVTNRMKGYIQQNRSVTISGISNDGWYAGSFYPIKTEEDLTKLSNLNPTTFCKLLSTAIVQNTQNQHIRTTNLTLHMKNYGLECDDFNNVIFNKDKNGPSIGKSSSPNKDSFELIPASSGSGFFVSTKGHVVTNQHVIKNCEKVTIKSNGNEIPASILAEDKQNDLALLHSDALNASSIIFNQTDPEISENIFAIGYPFGKKISNSVKVTKGIVSALTGLENDYNKFQIDAAVQPGNSGGPIINEDGHLVGVTVAKLDAISVFQKYGSIPENINFAVKLANVKNLLNAHSVSYITASDSIKNKRKISGIVNDSVVYISCLMSQNTIQRLRDERALFDTTQ